MFSVPTYPLVCNVYHFEAIRAQFATQFEVSWPPIGAIDIEHMPCNLAWGRRVSSEQGLTNFPASTFLMTLLFPDGYDVRSAACLGYPDLIECPAESGRVYLTQAVDALGLGFDNYHQGAILIAFGYIDSFYSVLDAATYYGVGWPGPMNP